MAFQKHLDFQVDNWFFQSPSSRMTRYVQRIGRRLLGPVPLRDGRRFQDASSIVVEAGISANNLIDIRRSLPWFHGYLGPKQLSVHLVIEEPEWTSRAPIEVDASGTGNDRVNQKLRTDNFTLTTAFVGRWDKAEIVAHSNGYGICPPTILLTELQDLMSLLTSYKSLKYRMQYSHRVTTAYHTKEEADREGIWISYEARQGSHHGMVDYIYQGYTQLMRQLCQEAYVLEVIQNIELNYGRYIEFHHLSCPCDRPVLCGGIDRLRRGEFCPVV
jgi:hypothetical protein